MKLDHYLQTWKSERELVSKSKGKEYKSWAQDLSAFKNFSEWCQMTPSELIAEAQENVKATQKRLLDWFESRQDKISFNSARTQLGVVRGFYTYNNIAFPKSFKQPQPQVSKVNEVYEGLDVWDYDEKGQRTGLNDVIRQFMDNLSLTHRTFAMVMLTTGAKASVISRLNVSFVLDTRGNLTDSDRLFMRTERKKNRQPIAVFISQEATSMLKRYYEQYRKSAESSEPLFIDERGERMSSKAIQDAFGRAANKLGVVNGDGNPLNPTRFRHIFRQAGIAAEVGEDLVAVMMGHKPKGEGMTYAGTDKGTILGPYLRIEKLLVVYGSEANSELKDLRQALNTVQSQHQRDMDYMKKSVESLTRSLKTVIEIAGAMSEELGGDFAELFKKHFGKRED